MLNLLDVIPEPTMNANEVIETAKSVPWIAAYVVIGVLVCGAVLVVIKQIRKSKKK